VAFVVERVRDTCCCFLLHCCAIAYFIMHNWLQNYAYWSPIPWWAFLGKGIGSIIIVLITVSAQAFKVAVSSPVKSLRTE
jgi:putative ABC transport system permease protein